MKIGLYISWFFILASLLSRFSGVSGIIGVGYGQWGDNLMAPLQVAQLIRTTYISSIRLYNADLSVLNAFAKTGIKVVVGLGNEQLPWLTDADQAKAWVNHYILPYEGITDIVGIAVGSETLTSDDSGLYPLLVPALKNLQSALQGFELDDKIKVSAPHSLAILAQSYPPSSALFRPDIATSVMKPLLQFLLDTKSPIMIDAYPYFAYRNNSQISLDYCLFRPNAGFVDPKTNLHYTNLFDAQVDAVYFAMNSLGFSNIDVVVLESGWPSKGGSDEPAATVENAQTYNKNLINHVSSGIGTPLKPKINIDTYIFSLFNENKKNGSLSEQYFGLYTPNGSPVYDAGLFNHAVSPNPPSSTGTPASPNPNPNPNPSPNPSPNPTPNPSPNITPTSSSHTWCVAKPNADDSALVQGINYACGAVDCQGIQNGGPCFNPQTVHNHASYAYNNYFQKHGRNSWNCDFHGTAMITATDPSYGSCQYIAG